MAFQQWDPDGPIASDPELTIYPDLNGYINSAADRQWFGDHNTVVLHADPDRKLLGIEPVEDGDYQLPREYEYGADLSTKYCLRDGLGLDEDLLDESAYLSIEWSDDHGFAIVDFRPLLEDEAESEASSEHTNKESEPSEPDQQGGGDDLHTGKRWCGQCGEQFENERGVKVHHGRADDHDGDANVREEPPEQPDIDEGEPSLDTVRDCVDSVETLSELADLFDVSDGTALRLAREADVKDQIKDDKPRMGAPGDA